MTMTISKNDDKDNCDVDDDAGDASHNCNIVIITVALQKNNDN